jgi:hypothetical protein
MRRMGFVWLFLAASACWAQQPSPDSDQPPASAQAQAPAGPAQEITIPSGTRVPLTLNGTITTKSRAGDAVRAVTAFPVTVDTQVAIPVGTYVEGVLDNVDKRAPSVQMHFTRLLYANGYSVAVQGTNVVAKTIESPSTPAASAFAGGIGPSYAVGQQPPPLPPLPQPQSHIGTAVAIGVGAIAAGIVGAVLLARHRGATNGVLFQPGWQFEMVLQSPLSVDAASVGANHAAPATQ